MPDASVDDAARLSLEARLTAVAHHLPLAAYHAEQDVEHVHRLRVSTRTRGRRVRTLSRLVAAEAGPLGQQAAQKNSPRGR